MATIKTIEQNVISHFIYDVKDKETKQPTGEKKVIIKYVGKAKNKETGYYEDVILPFYISLTDLLNVLGLNEGDSAKIGDKLKDKKLVITTEIK